MPGLSLASIAELLDILPDAVLMVDAGSRIVYCNQAVHSLLGYAPTQLQGEPLAMLLPKSMRDRHDGMVARYQDAGVAMKMGARPVLAATHHDGREVPVSISICNLGLEGGGRVSVAVLHDVSTLHTHLDRANELAETDPLTGLANRLRLSRRMQALLAGEHPFAVLYMDLQSFKPFNDRFGHAAGDEALRVVAQRLQAQVRGDDLVARQGGDEFVVLLEGLDKADLLLARAKAIQSSVTRPLRIASGGGALGINIGGALRPLHGNSEEALLAAADQAMYQAKTAGDGYRLAA